MRKARTIKMRIGFVVAILISALRGSLMAVVTAYSTTWEGSYEMDTFPPSGEWEAVNGIETLCTIVFDPNGSGNYYLNSDGSDAYPGIGSWNFVANALTNGGASFEFRARFNSGSDAVAGHIFTTAVVGDPHYYWLTYYISSTDVEIYNTNGNDPGQQDRTLDTAEWHTYRFTNDGTDWNLYIDDNYTEPLTLTAVPFSGEGIPYDGYFAFFLPGSDINADLDYMRYTDAGAFPPPGPPPVCGANGYKVSDFNEDCYVNLADLSFIASEWLVCTDPANADCDQYWK